MNDRGSARRIIHDEETIVRDNTAPIETGDDVDTSAFLGRSVADRYHIEGVIGRGRVGAGIHELY